MNEKLLSWKRRWSVSLQELGHRHYKLYRGLVEGVEFAPSPNFKYKPELIVEVQILYWLGKEIKTNGTLRDQVRGALAQKKCFDEFVEIFSNER